jgi:hypothetical protein
MNVDGTPENLIAAQPGNANATRHGIYSQGARILSPRAREIAEHVIRAAPILGPADVFGAEEIGSLIATIEAIDIELQAGGLVRRGADRVALLKLRIQASRRLAEWLDRYGMTPRGRVEFVHMLKSGALANEIARRRTEEEAQ